MNLEKNQKFKPGYFEIPGKTFLVGEYAVLSGGTCLGLATKPSFSINLKNEKQFFHPDSPAGKYLSKYQLENFKHELINPYGVGGFGASTAEFIFSYFSNPSASVQLEDIYFSYLDLYADCSAQKPSGADLLTQLVGTVSYIDLSQAKPKVNKTNWLLGDTEILIYSTGQKIKTHEHLANLDRRICAGLTSLSQEVALAFGSGDSQLFKEGLREWSKKLEQLNLTAPSVLELKTFLQSHVGDILVKPCGALGADVIVVLCKKEQKQHVFEQIAQLNIKGLGYQADSTHLTNGPLSI